MDEYPMRINKYLAHQKIATRKDADALVSRGNVFINGERAVLGSKVNEYDKVEVRGQKNTKKYVYYAYNKPQGVITHSPQDEETDIKEKIKNQKIGNGVFPVGRLDKDSHGLMILTNDGRITDLLLNPKHIHDKEYVVKTKEKLRSNFKQKMEAGVNIEDYKTKPCKVEIINENMFRVILTEGKKHQIRRMCSALFQEVADLKRTKIMNIELGKMSNNSFREIKGKELETFLQSMGIK
jgi:23S rRNA pseudouridine2604 synthase